MNVTILLLLGVNESIVQNLYKNPQNLKMCCYNGNVRLFEKTFHKGTFHILHLLWTKGETFVVDTGRTRKL